MSRRANSAHSDVANDEQAAEQASRDTAGSATTSSPEEGPLWWTNETCLMEKEDALVRVVRSSDRSNRSRGSDGTG